MEGPDVIISCCNVTNMNSYFWFISSGLHSSHIWMRSILELINHLSCSEWSYRSIREGIKGVVKGIILAFGPG